MSGEILLRVELHEPEQARQVLARNALPWVGEQLAQGRELVAEFRLLDDDITQKQRAFFHAVVLDEFSRYAHCHDGAHYPPEVWKVFLKEKFLGFKVVTSIDPITGRKRRLRHRVSTEELGIRRYAQFIDECTAFAATDCGLTISEPLPPELRPGRRKARTVEHTDEDGVITEVPA